MTIILFSFDIIQYFQIVLALFTLTNTIYYFEKILILRIMVIVSSPIKFYSVIASFFSRKKKFYAKYKGSTEVGTNLCIKVLHDQNKTWSKT